MIHSYNTEQPYLKYILIFILFLQNCNNYLQIPPENTEQNNRSIWITIPIPSTDPNPKVHASQQKLIPASGQKTPDSFKEGLEVAIKKEVALKIKPPDSLPTSFNKAVPTTLQPAIITQKKSTHRTLQSHALPARRATTKKRENIKEQISLPNPQLIHFNNLVGQPELSVEEHKREKSEAHALLRESIALKLAADQNTSKLPKAISQLLIVAQSLYVAHSAMYHLGDICEKIGDIDLAVKWYALSFQNNWFLDVTKAYTSVSYNALKRLSDQGVEIAKRILLIHPSNLDTPEKRFLRCGALISFYENETTLPYLSKEERKAIIDRINIEMTLLRVVFLSSALEQAIKEIQTYLIQGVNCMDKFEYQQAEALFLQATPSPQALHNLGVFYEMGHATNGKPDYQKAADFYQQAKTPESFCSLGSLYRHGHIGKVNGQPDYQTAIEYFELSGIPEALYNLGQLYMQGHVGAPTTQPDYEKAKYYFEMAAKKEYPDAFSKLGVLYLSKLVGRVNDRSTYELAIDCFQKSIQSANTSAFSKAESFHNLGIMYIIRYEGFGYDKPDYLQAQKCFEQAGLPESFLQLAHLYQAGNIGDQPNYQLAIDFFQKAIQSANIATSSRAEAFHKLGVIYMTKYKELGYDKPAYLQAKEYFEQANLPQSLYCLAEFYQEGYIDDQPDYNKALAYYSQSNLAHSKICILNLYLSERIKVESHRRKQRIIDELIREIDALLPSLADNKRSYIQGIVAYCTGNWDDALIFLEQALMGGYQDEGSTRELIEQINRYFDSTENITENNIIKDQKQPVKIQLNLSAVGKDTHTIQQLIPIKFTFLDEVKEQEFLAFEQKNGKVTELLDEIKACSWTIHGVGKPEVLKRSFKGYRGCLSRRINHEDRLVYKAKGVGEILILSWQGHYEN
jgi:TPR repeat protein/Txe/YoeB family toxin of Txe-Axe toxin-antitoxin module